MLLSGLAENFFFKLASLLVFISFAEYFSSFPFLWLCYKTFLGHSVILATPPLHRLSPPKVQIVPPVLDRRWAMEHQSISRRSSLTGASVAHSSAASTLRKMDWLAESPKEAKHAVKRLCITWLLICKV